MEARFKILIAERNPRVRRFLEREFNAGGYLVLLAVNGSDLSQIIRREDTLDLLILDDELPGLDDSGLVEQLGNRIPFLPFVIHSFSTECVSWNLTGAAAALVEKTGNFEELREAVHRVLRREYPYRFDTSERSPLEGDARDLGYPASARETRKA